MGFDGHTFTDTAAQKQLSEALSLGHAQSSRSSIDNAGKALSTQANEIGMSGLSGTAERLALVTGQGLLKTGQGALETVKHEGLGGLAITAGESAALGLGLRLVLAKAAPVARIATAVMGTIFAAGTLPKYYDAYSSGLKARTWKELDQASSTFGLATGELAVNTIVGISGFKVGSGLAGKLALNPTGMTEVSAPANVLKPMESSPEVLKPVIETAKIGKSGFEKFNVHDQKFAPVEILETAVTKNHQNLITRIDALGDNLPRIAFHGPTAERTAKIENFYSGKGDDASIFIASPKTTAIDPSMRLADLANSHVKADSYRYPGQPLFAFDLTGTADGAFMTKKLQPRFSSVGHPFAEALDSYEADLPLSKMKLLTKIPGELADWVQPDHTAADYLPRINALTALHRQAAIDAVISTIEFRKP